MKKKLLSLLALVMTVMTASAIDVPTYALNKAQGAEANGTIKFYLSSNLNNEISAAAEGDAVTMTITPDANWVVNTDKVAGLWTASEAKAPRRVDMAKDIALTYVSTDATTNAVTYTFTMIRANAEISCAYKKLMTNEDITVEVAEATYTGSPLEPVVTVKDNGTPLTLNTDYTVSYSNNTNAALSTATTNAPTVTITAVSTSEKYTGMITKTFTIDKAAGSISYTKSTVTKTYGNSAFTNALTKTYSPTSAANGTNLGTITYSSSNTSVATVNSSGRVTIRGAGTATIKATATDGANCTYSNMTNYNSTTHQASVSYTLKVNTASMSVSASGYSGVYDGKSHDITVAVSKPISGYTIKYGTTSGNYNLSSSPTRTDAGTTTVYYQVTAPNYTKTTGNVDISIRKADLSVTADDKSVTYGDAAPEYTVTYDGFVNNETESVLGGTLNMACEYAAGSNAGTYSITPSGLTSNNYNVTYNPGTLTVDPADLSAAAVMLNPTQTTFEYDGAAKEPAVMYVILGDNKILAAGTDYTVSYRNNVNAATFDSENAPAAVVTGIGNYTGEASQVFTIVPVTTTVGNVTIVDGGNTNRELTVLDMGNQQGSTLPEDLVVTTLNYYRTLNVDEFAYTVCLPYAPPTENLTYYTLTDVNDGTLHFNEIDGDPQANTPYLVIAGQTTPISKENVSNVTMSKTVANEASAGGYVLKGTLSGIKHDDALGLYILQPGNRWGVIVADKKAAYVPPFRAYIEATTTDAREMLESSFDGNVTGLQNIRTTAKDGTERWYDLNGRRIEKPATKGVYIQNGRKIVVK